MYLSHVQLTKYVLLHGMQYYDYYFAKNKYH